MFIKLKDKSETEVPFEMEENASAKHLAEKLNLTDPKEALAVSINGKIKDLSTPLQEGDLVFFISFDSKEGKEVFWHTSAHVLAQAILRLWPNAVPTIGPPIENGFYYDFANLTLSEEDFPKIEEEMQKVISENFKPQKKVLSGKKEAIETFKSNPYKVEIIESFKEGDEITAYTQGEFFDLCRGPHLPQLNKIKALKITKTSGAYWRANSDNEMLTRVYGITFPEKKLLKEYLEFLEEAKKRDHKILGPKLDLFSLKEEAPGMPFIHPKGLIIWNELVAFLRSLLRKRGYVEIKTPTMMTRELWEKSGHWKNYKENMFTSVVESRDFAIKPMNCPGCMLYYLSHLKSYRDFPLRVAEIGNVHRFEPSGSLSGLFRVRSFHQDDAHIFMTPEQIEEEILNTLLLAEEIYHTFGLQYHLELSTKPEANTIGTDEEWEYATQSLKNALDRSKKTYKINPGDGAFYGPKIDFHIKDALNRTWQCGTVQLDMALPQKFELEYTAKDGTKKQPVMIHRAIFGSIERFFGILIEHFAGRFPLWLSPLQVRVLTVAERHEEAASHLVEELLSRGFNVALDNSIETFNKKVRIAQLDQVNYMLIVGDKEAENKTLSIRSREGKQLSDVSLSSFIEMLEKERNTKALASLL